MSEIAKTAQCPFINKQDTTGMINPHTNKTNGHTTTDGDGDTRRSVDDSNTDDNNTDDDNSNNDDETNNNGEADELLGAKLKSN